MSFNGLNAVAHFIIQKLSGKNLNAADPSSSMMNGRVPFYTSSLSLLLEIEHSKFKISSSLNLSPKILLSIRILPGGWLVATNLNNNLKRSFIEELNHVLIA